ncbi:MAG: D-2-hydroxyacid dehydrogenase [Chloroflexi bacterium]|nr:D-2-hydroxyacid dehydrogenase [Chloroflexota bacterium]
MNPVNVCVTFPSSQEILDMINAVSPRVRIVDISPWLRDEATSAEAKAKVDVALRDVEVMFVARVPRDVLTRAPRLKWAQYVGTGVDALWHAGLANAPFTITNVTGTNALPIAEHCFLFMLMWAKHARQFLQLQKDHSYARDSVRPLWLERKTLGVLGIGGIGSEVARLGKAFQMRVLATRRSATRRQSNVDGVDVVYPITELRSMLGECDYVVNTLPLTKETERSMGEAEFKAMKQTAFLVNVGRGKLFDEPALVRALKDGTIAGAGLDVFATEPLPADSPLWDLPNVYMTPHVSGDLVDNRERAARLFCDNLKRFITGQPLRNVVDPKRGY